jgi:hypothetical protein
VYCALLHHYYAHGPGAMIKNLQLKVLCCCGTISCCTTAGLTINVALVGINKLSYPVADVSALTVNTPGLEPLLIFHVCVRIPKLSVLPLNLVVTVFVESVTIARTPAPAIVTLETAASVTIILSVSISPAIIGFFSTSIEINGFELLLSDDNFTSSSRRRTLQ